MSLVTIHTLEINGIPAPSFISINTGKITQVEDRSGKAFLRFSPFTGREETFLIEEPVEHIFNAPVQTESTTLSFATTEGSLSVEKSNILKVYPTDYADRVYMAIVSGTEIIVYTIKSRWWDVVAAVNTVPA